MKKIWSVGENKLENYISSIPPNTERDLPQNWLLPQTHQSKLACMGNVAKAEIETARDVNKMLTVEDIALLMDHNKISYTMSTFHNVSLLLSGMRSFHIICTAAK